MTRPNATFELRMIVVYLVRLILLALAGWFVLAPASLPGAHPITRGGLAASLLVLSILIGEVDRLRTQFDALLRALRQATGKAAGTAGGEEAVPILIRALGSRDAEVREKAHRNLVRLTGRKDLPPRREAWEQWWSSRSTGGEEEADHPS